MSKGMAAKSADLIFEAKAELGEGAIWHAQQQVLYWVDILGKRFWRYDPATGAHDSFDIGQYVGTVVPRKKGGVVLALHRGIATYDLKTKKLGMVVDVEDNKPMLRFNDGKCDPSGRFWAGTMMVQGSAPMGTLFCLRLDWRAEKKLTGVGCSNGIVWSLDQKTMYFIDTALWSVDAFTYDAATANICNRRVAIKIPKDFGYPDGSTLDAEGMLWVAHFGGARVTRWNPVTGQLLETVPLPTSNITSCAFGGPQLDRLYVTSARVALSPEKQAAEPHAGGLFCLDVGVKGIEAFEFLG
jgi:sugar lactone lactonase YvrE